MAPNQSPAHSPVGPVHVYQQDDGSRHVRVVAPLFGYRADDIVVRPEGEKLLLIKVSQNKEEILDTISLPESLDPYTIDAHMDKVGRLIVEAPLVC